MTRSPEQIRRRTSAIIGIAAVFSVLALCTVQSKARSVSPASASTIALPLRTAPRANPSPKTLPSSAVKIITVSDTDSGTVAVTFEIRNCHTVMGQNVYVIGNVAKLGEWHADKAFPLTIQGSGANVPWKGTIRLPANAPIQYKYIVWDGKTVTWETDQKTPSKNREFTTPASGSTEHHDGDFLMPVAK